MKPGILFVAAGAAIFLVILALIIPGKKLSWYINLAEILLLIGIAASFIIYYFTMEG